MRSSAVGGNLRQLRHARRRARLRNAGEPLGALAALAFQLRDPLLQRVDFLAVVGRLVRRPAAWRACSCSSFSCFCSRPSCESFSAIASSSCLRSSSCSRCAADAKMMLSSLHAPGLAIQIQRLELVLRHAEPLLVHRAEIEQRARIALVRGLLIPLRGGFVVRRARPCRARRSRRHWSALPRSPPSAVCIQMRSACLMSARS